jgi:hypothetical protein
MHRRCCRLVTWMRWNAVPPHPSYQLAASSVYYITSCKHSLVLLRIGENIARNVFSWLELLINPYCLRLVGSSYYCGRWIIYRLTETRDNTCLTGLLMKELFENTSKVEIFKIPLRRKWSPSSNNRLTSEWKAKTTYALNRREFSELPTFAVTVRSTKHGGKHSNMLGFIFISHGKLGITTSSTRNININKVFIKKITKQRTNFQHVEKFNSQ